MSKPSEANALKKALASARRLFTAVGAFSFFINLLMLVAPLYMLQVYDRVLASRSQETLVALTVLAVSLIGVSALLELVRSRILVRLGARFERNLQSPIFAALFDHQLQGRTANGGQYLRDVESLRGFLTGPGVIAFFDCPWTPAFIALIFFFHPLLGAVALTGALLLFIVAVISELATRGPLQRSVSRMHAAHEFASSALRNAEAIRVMGMLGHVRDRWIKLQSGGMALQGRASDYAGSLTAVSKFIRPCLQIAMLGVGAWLVLQEAITPGVMIAGSIIMGRALAPVEAAINNWRQFIAARGAHARLTDLLETNPPAPDTLPLEAPEGRIRFDNVTAVAPQGGKPVLQGVSFDLEPGQMLGVIGPSAAGKSTLARLMVGVWPPASGHVRLDGADLDNWHPEQLGVHIGYLPQDIELLAGTVAENIARMREPEADKVIAAARLCGAHDMILKLPKGYDTHIGEGGSVLSGGQRQRIALARALYGGPTLIVLDEPNANLDSDGEAALQATLMRLKDEGRTVVIVSHRSAILTAVDQVAVLRGGRLETFGRRDEVLPRLMSGIRSLQGAGQQRKERAYAGGIERT
ncbi:type I secretion system permease/ATPase [Chelativorans sp. M5D2P16]|uniref:type I secretion system permease/ATPase n=1 Tax=Chelativorans sp. M5D2P16 TaxID=3095678 RepID=UPI002ACA49FA|nr:type I secretion system permease/ATPase [Chelativorans sp. M5D2P16]MDZ5697093.1 type I secretion system permease/ATPase [Chelativorans sp. M5D2P16]